MTDSAPNPRKPFYRRWWFITLVVLVIVGALARGTSDRRVTADDELQSDMDTSGTSVQAAAVVDTTLPAITETQSASDVKADITIPAEPEPEVTLATFRQIKTGMSAKKVWKILGPGELSVESGDYSIYTWSASEGFGNVSITFDGDKVQSKAQAGLK